MKGLLRRWFHWSLVNDNAHSSKPGGVGSVWRQGRFSLWRSGEKSGRVFWTEWAFWSRYGWTSVDLEWRFSVVDESCLTWHLGLSRFASVWVSVPMPHRLLHRLMYQERIFGIRVGYIGYVAWLLFAYDEQSVSTGMLPEYLCEHNERICFCEHKEASHMPVPDYGADGLRLSCPVCGEVVWELRTLETRGAGDEAEGVEMFKSHYRREHVSSRPPLGLADAVQCNADYAYQQPCWCRVFGFERMQYSRAELWPGWEWKLRLRPLDWVFGQKAYSKIVERVWGDVEVPLDGRTFPARVTLHHETWKRPRAFWVSNRRRGTEIEMTGDVPAFSGKGENSWDCGDDAIFGMGSKETTPQGIVADYVRAVLKYRERYGKPSKPVMEVSRGG